MLSKKITNSSVRITYTPALSSCHIKLFDPTTKALPTTPNFSPFLSVLVSGPSPLLTPTRPGRFWGLLALPAILLIATWALIGWLIGYFVSGIDRAVPAVPAGNFRASVKNKKSKGKPRAREPIHLFFVTKSVFHFLLLVLFADFAKKKPKDSSSEKYGAKGRMVAADASTQ